MVSFSFSTVMDISQFVDYLREGLTLLVEQCIDLITSQGGGRRALVNLGAALVGGRLWFRARRAW